MEIEAIKNAGVAYQGSSSVASVKETPKACETANNNAVATHDTARPVENINIDSADESNPAEKAVQVLQAQQAEQNAQIKKAVEEINKSAMNDQAEAIFGIHEKTHRVTIKIVDKKTKEVIKEYPPEKTLDMIAKVWEMAGIMVDEKR